MYRAYSERRTGKRIILDDQQKKSSGKTEYQTEQMQGAALRLQ